MAGLTLNKIYEDMYNGTPSRVVSLRVKGEVTGRKHGFHPVGSRPTIRQAWVDKFPNAIGRTAAEMHVSLTARPVYMIPGRGGKAAILIGEPSWNYERLSHLEKPANVSGFRKWVHRGGPFAAGELDSLSWGGVIDPEGKLTHPMWWKHGSATWDSEAYPEYGTQADPDGLGNSTLVPSVFDMWKTCSLGQGIKVLFRHHGVKIDGITFGPNHMFSYRAHGQYEANFASIPASPHSQGAAMDLLAEVSAAQGPCTLAHPMINSLYWSSGAQKTFDGKTVYVVDGRMREDIDSETLSYFMPGFRSQVGSLYNALTGAPPDSIVCGSILPLPLTSQQIGWVTGFGTDHGPVMIEVESFAASADKVDILVSWASVDMTGKDFKRVYPLSSLSATERAQVEGKIGELPDNVWFRTVLFSGGLKYPTSVSYDKTIIAVDAARAGSSLDELLFDALEDDGPPVSYESLGARSLVSISKGKNVYVSVVLDADGSSFVSAVPIEFYRDATNDVKARQGGFEISAAEAQVSARAGVKCVFIAPVTPLEVATNLFNLPTWDAVLVDANDVTAARKYLIDENANSNDLRFDISDDESARAIPLLLGFDRFDFAKVPGALALGVTVPEVL